MGFSNKPFIKGFLLIVFLWGVLPFLRVSYCLFWVFFFFGGGEGSYCLAWVSDFLWGGLASLCFFFFGFSASFWGYVFHKPHFFGFLSFSSLGLEVFKSFEGLSRVCGDYSNMWSSETRFLCFSCPFGLSFGNVFL